MHQGLDDPLKEKYSTSEKKKEEKAILNLCDERVKVKG